MRERSLAVTIVVLLALLSAGACSAYTPGDPEFRAFWVDAWHDGALSQSQVNKLLGVVGDPASKGDLRNANCNAIILQVRRRADTCYPSHMGEPYYSGLTPADFNALQAVINAAHDTTGGKQRIEVHCWMVTFANQGGGKPPGPVYYAHNNPADPANYWMTLDDSGHETDDKAFDPGHPKCLEYIVGVCMDLVNNFNIDGIHYDYIRFTGANQGYNPTSIARYNARYGTTGNPPSDDTRFDQWRRDQVSAVVRQVYAKIQASKPSVKQSGSFVTWNPSPLSSDRAGFQATRPYYDVFSDWDSWLQEGIVDMGVPMNYYDEAVRATDYANWMNFAKDRKANRHMYIGPGVYMNSLSNSILQLKLTRDPSPAGNYAQGWSGYSYFAPYTHGGTNYGSWAEYSPELLAQVTTTPATIPAMPWKATPTKGHISGAVTLFPTGDWADGANVTMEGPAGRTQTCDGTGFYAFIDLNPGSYMLRVSRPGYPTRQKIVNVAVGNVTGNMYVTDMVLGGPTPPVITGVQSSNVTGNSATITWTTEGPATSQVEYGVGLSYGQSSPPDSSAVTSHTVTLTGLTPSTIYHYRAISTNSDGLSTSLDCSFTTLTAPVISNLQVTSVTASGATVSWTTNVGSTTQVFYGTALPYGQSTTKSNTMVTSHTANLTGLTANTLYHLSAASANGVGVAGYSIDVTFATKALPPVVIVDNLQGTPLTGTWTPLTDSGGWPTTASQYVYATNKQSSTTATFSWTPTIPVAGKYNVYCWYKSNTDRTTSARYTVGYSGGQVLVTAINQTANGSQWVLLTTTGAKQFDAGTTSYVQLTNKTGEADGTKKVIADAVKFEYAETDTTPPSVPTNLAATASSQTQIDLTWTPSTDNVAVMGYKVYRDTQILAIVPSAGYSDTGLFANSQHTYAVSTYDACGNDSAQCAPVSRYSLARPVATPHVTSEKTVNTWSTTPPVIFTNDGFGVGKLASYRYAWDTSANHTWTDLETAWTASSAALNAPSGTQRWYLHAKGYNGDGVACGTLDMGPYRCDSDVPSLTVNAPLYLQVLGTSYPDVSATWNATDAVSGVAEYQYAIGTTSGGSDIKAWTSAGAGTSATYHDSQALSDNHGYYWSVKCRDQAGNWSPVKTASPTMYARTYSTIASAMDNPDGTAVWFDSYKDVIGEFEDAAYIEEPDRSRGLRVETPVSLTQGDAARIAGTLAGSSSERFLSRPYVGSAGGGATPGALFTRIASLGGKSPNSYTPGLPGASGLYNIGLLVRVAGKVASNTSGSFVLDDGSGATVKVYSNKPVSNGAYVGATGVCCVEDGSAVIRTRSLDDAVVYAP